MKKPERKAMTAVEMGRKGGLRRAKALSAERRKAIAIGASKAAAKKRIAETRKRNLPRKAKKKAS